MDELGSHTPEGAENFVEANIPEGKSKFEQSIFESSELSDDETKALLGRLNTPSVEVDYTSPGAVNVKTDSYHYDFGFEAPGETNKAPLLEYLDWLNTESRPGRYYVLPDPVDVFFIEEWKVLNSFSIHKDDTPNSVPLSDLLPEELNIYFYPSNEFINATYHHEQKMIVLLGGDMASPINIASLLHEIGHAWDEVNIASGETKRIEQGKNSDLMEKLRKERIANAFALKSLRSFVKNDPQLRDDLHKYLKNYALQSYHLGLGENLKRREEMLVVAQEMAKDYDMDSFEAEEEQRAMFEEFIQWKETEEYQVWKLLEENRDADEHDEFGLWRSWCENNGRAWWKVTR